ncbi:hypothetical protein ACWDE9_05110 [Streptomyces olivaceoviridis]
MTSAAPEWTRPQNESALVHLGRRPLAEALGLVLPGGLAEERTMGRLVTRISRRRYTPAAVTAFAPCRARPGPPEDGGPEGARDPSR